VVGAFAGVRGMMQVWPAALVAGAAFAIPQFLISNFHGPWLVDIVASISSIVALVLLLKFWRPKEIWKLKKEDGAAAAEEATTYTGKQLFHAWLPWILLSTLVFIWGVPAVKNYLNDLSLLRWEVPGLHNVVHR